jgi:hypothetical protein
MFSIGLSIEIDMVKRKFDSRHWTGNRKAAYISLLYLRLK